MDFVNLISRPRRGEDVDAAIARQVRPIVEDRLGPDIGNALVELLNSPPEDEEAKEPWPGCYGRSWATPATTDRGGTSCAVTKNKNR